MNIKQELSFLKKILSSLPEHIYWLDRNNIVLGCNDLQAKRLGLSPDAIIGKSLHDLYADDIADIITSNNNKVMDNDKTMIFEEPEIGRDGVELTFLSHKVPLHNEQMDVIGVLGISTDITHYKRDELLQLDLFAKMNREITGESLQQQPSIFSYSENIRGYLERIITLMPGNVYWKNKNGVILGCNDNMAKYFGFQNRAELIGKTDYDLSDKKQADYIKNIDESIMDSGKPKTLEEISKLENRETVFFLTRKEPLYDANNNIIGLLGISINITKNKKAEEKLLKEKLEAMNAIAASIAHELRTPLASIVNGTGFEKFLPRLFEAYEMAKQANLPVGFIRNDLMENMKTALDRIRREAYSGSKIIELLLANIRVLESPENSFELCSINQCINAALDRYPFNPPEERNKVKYINGSDFTFKGESILIEHIISNLLKNALHYVTKARKGDIRIWIESNHKYNELHFKDTSAGIDPEIMPKIFNHFISRTQNGTGLGLAFCKAAMEKMGGTIICDSKVNEFAEFILNFPKPIR